MNFAKRTIKSPYHFALKTYLPDELSNHWHYALPWTYYLLDGGQRQHAVYEGRQISDLTPYNCGNTHEVFWVASEYLIHGAGDVPFLSLLPNGDKRYRIQDNLGSTRVVLSADGAVYDWNTYEPFGTVLNSGGGQQNSDRLSYIGKEKDAESDLGDFGVRKYESETGRFLSVDPLWEKYRKLTPYHYCGNNPLIYRDPTGFDYNVVMGANTVTVSMTIVVGDDDDSKRSANLGKELWESNNGKYEFVTTINGEEKRFDVVFKVNLVTEIPENISVIGGVNTFDVRDDDDKIVFNSKTDPEGTREGVSYYNYATGFQEAHVKKSSRNSKSTAGHEIGHLFGLSHRQTGLMADDKSKVTSNLDITAGLVNSIINNATPGREPETKNCRAFASPNLQSGQVFEKE